MKLYALARPGERVRVVVFCRKCEGHATTSSRFGGPASAGRRAISFLRTRYSPGERWVRGGPT